MIFDVSVPIGPRKKSFKTLFHFAFLCFLLICSGGPAARRRPGGPALAMTSTRSGGPAPDPEIIKPPPSFGPRSPTPDFYSEPPSLRAQAEMGHAPSFGHLIVNDEFEEAYREMSAIYRAGRTRTASVWPRLAPLLGLRSE